jgi:hypothetical protein
MLKIKMMDKNNNSGRRIIKKVESQEKNKERRNDTRKQNEEIHGHKENAQRERSRKLRLYNAINSQE